MELCNCTFGNKMISDLPPRLKFEERKKERKDE
jgi:hypothetical protein